MCPTVTPTALRWAAARKEGHSAQMHAQLKPQMSAQLCAQLRAQCLLLVSWIGTITIIWTAALHSTQASSIPGLEGII